MKTTTTCKTTKTFSLTGGDILELLVQAGEIDSVDTATVLFSVPSGGDYSGMSIEIDDFAPVMVWVETEETHNE